MDSGAPCKRCGRHVPALVLAGDAFDTVVRALAGGSGRLAALECRHVTQCSEADAADWIAHLLDCSNAWPTAPADACVLDRIDAAFAGIEKPLQFTDRTHCRECAQHDDTLRARGVHTLRRSDLGNGIDPIGFACADGIGYFFPALARFALLPDVWRQYDWYAVDLVRHLRWDAQENRFLAWCSPARRDVVHALLVHLAATRADAML